jgi:hypothetical protein
MEPTGESLTVAMARFACDLLARMEAVEALLIQKGIASEEEVRRNREAARERLDPHVRWLESPDREDFDTVLADTLRRLRVAGTGYRR